MNARPQTGRQRLRLLLGALGAGGCAAAMAGVLIFYGTPYNPIWWWVMGAVLVGAGALPPLLAGPIEWVIEGYLKSPPR